MSDPLPDSAPDPIVLDSSVLVAYEWMKTPGAGHFVAAAPGFARELGGFLESATVP